MHLFPSRFLRSDVDVFLPVLDMMQQLVAQQNGGIVSICSLQRYLPLTYHAPFHENNALLWGSVNVQTQISQALLRAGLILTVRGRKKFS